MKRLVSIKEGADYLGRKSVDSLRELLYRKEIRCIQRGRGKIWLDIRELDKWIEENLKFM